MFELLTLFSVLAMCAVAFGVVFVAFWAIRFVFLLALLPLKLLFLPFIAIFVIVKVAVIVALSVAAVATVVALIVPIIVIAILVALPLALVGAIT